MHIHFIGIGGIGTSALAQYYITKGHKVSGSDLVSSEITDLLKKKANIFIGKHKPANFPKNVDLVVYSPAVQRNNPELKKALKLQITNCPSTITSLKQTRTNKLQILSYPEALGRLTKKYFTIAVSGTHGKSTTTAMLGSILIKAGLDPTIIIGTKLKKFNNSNFRAGNTKYLIIEADEWQASFLNYWPKIIVLTNIEKEHLDYYKNLNHILKTYKEYIGHLPKEGILVVNGDDKNISKLKTQSSKLQLKTKNFSLKQEEARKLKKILKVPGKHNIYNALAALTTARVLKISDKISFEALSEYKGCWRRFEERELKIKNLKLKIISDYAHHPTEIKATLSTVREKFKKRKVWAIFQPHQHQRTFYLFNDFIKAFNKADEVIITEIYNVAGREEKEISKKINALGLAEAIKKQGKNTYFIKNFQKIPQFLKNRVKSDDIILIMGAGNIYKLANQILNTFKFKH